MDIFTLVHLYCFGEEQGALAHKSTVAAPVRPRCVVDVNSSTSLILPVSWDSSG